MSWLLPFRVLNWALCYSFWPIFTLVAELWIPLNPHLLLRTLWGLYGSLAIGKVPIVPPPSLFILLSQVYSTAHQLIAPSPHIGRHNIPYCHIICTITSCAHAPQEGHIREVSVSRLGLQSLIRISFAVRKYRDLANTKLFA